MLYSVVPIAWNNIPCYFFLVTWVKIAEVVAVVCAYTLRETIKRVIQFFRSLRPSFTNKRKDLHNQHKIAVPTSYFKKPAQSPSTGLPNVYCDHHKEMLQTLTRLCPFFTSYTGKTDSLTTLMTINGSLLQYLPNHEHQVVRPYCICDFSLWPVKLMKLQ